MAGTRSIRTLLGHRRIPIAAALIAVVLALPALWTGLHSDDFALRLALRDDAAFPAQSGSPMHLFSFADGDPERNLRAMDAGLLPWWSVETLRLSFWRPLAALTHILDYVLWPESPAMMHLQSLIWFAILIVSAAALYRRILGATWIAGAAALLFAVDDAHAVAATWLASRNVVLSGLFSILALIAHDCWRRDDSRSGALVAPICLLAALLSGEVAVATGGYLLAYALFLDRGRRWRRAASLLPSLAVIVGWYLVYTGLGYGTFGSGVYIDPGREPLRFAVALVERGPLQLLAQWAFPPTDVYVWLSSGLARGVWLAAIVLTALLVLVLGPLLRVDRRARFFAAGMLLALVPNATTIPNDRILILVGLGAMGLLAVLIGALVERLPSLPRSRTWQATARAFAAALLVIHGVVAPILLPVRATLQHEERAFTQSFVEALPNNPQVEDRQLVMVNAPGGLWGTFFRTMRRERGLPVPDRVHVLATGVRRLAITRTGTHTLSIRPVGGYLAPARTPPRADKAPPAVSTAYLLQQADLVFRGEGHPMPPGHRIHLTGLTVEVTAITDDGRPSEATFRFDVPLEDPGLLWLQWTRAGYVPFELPQVGQTVELPGLLERDR